MGPVVADIPQQLIGIFNHRRAFIRPDRGNLLTHAGDFYRIGNHHLPGLLLPQILKFLQHLLRGAQIQGRLLVRVLKSLSGHNNPAVNLILRIQEMDVAGSHHRLVVLFSQPDDGAVVFLQLLHRLGILIVVPGHKHVVAQRLNLQIIIELHDACQFLGGSPPDNGPEQFARLAGRSQNQTLPVFLQHALGHSGPSVVILQMGPGNQPVQIDPAHVVCSQQNGVIGRQLFNLLLGGLSQLI